MRVRLSLCVPRRKKPAAFRFRGLRKSRESCISAVSFLLLPIEPHFDGVPEKHTAGGIGRHASLRNWCPRGHGSSSLPPCTICAGAGTGIRVGFKNRRRKACGFDPRSAHQYTLLAQSVEQQTFNLWVGGPIPPGRTKCRCGAIGRRIRFKIGKTVGSSPTICTITCCV